MCNLPLDTAFCRLFHSHQARSWETCYVMHRLIIRVRTLFFVGLLLWCACTFAPAQVQSTPPNAQPQVSGPRYSVSGTVVNAVTGEPVPHALVMVFFTVQHATFTDQNGQFTIGDLPDAMRTTVQVFKPGYFSVAE